MLCEFYRLDSFSRSGDLASGPWEKQRRWKTTIEQQRMRPQKKPKPFSFSENWDLYDHHLELERVAIPREVTFVSQIFSVQNMRYSFSSWYLSYLKCWVGIRLHFGSKNKRRGARPRDGEKRASNGGEDSPDGSVILGEGNGEISAIRSSVWLFWEDDETFWLTWKMHRSLKTSNLWKSLRYPFKKCTADEVDGAESPSGRPFYSGHFSIVFWDHLTVEVADAMTPQPSMLYCDWRWDHVGTLSFKRRLS
jgi:hypothetical protein